jgi:starch synthase
MGASRARHVVLLLNNPFTADSRSWKLARSLTAAGSRVTVVARTAPDLPALEAQDDVRVVRVAQPRPLAWLPTPGLPGSVGAGGGVRDRIRDTVGRAAQALRYLLLARTWADRIAAVVEPADIWQSEGLVTLPVALRLRARRGGLVVYDSRDVHVESARFARLPGPWRRLLARGERGWAGSADAVVTVSKPYAEVLEPMLGRAVTVVMNGPVAWERPDPPERLLHARLGLDPSTRVLLYLGAVAANRGVEQSINAMDLVDDATLVVIGEGPVKAACQQLARRSAAADRIHFLAAAAPADILPLTASADVAIMPVIGSTLNHRLNTPTKLFDAMGAGTPVVASDLPGMAPIVRETRCGLLCDPRSPGDIARAIREVIDAPPERREAFTQACLAAAHGTYAWERQVERLLELYARIEQETASRKATS